MRRWAIVIGLFVLLVYCLVLPAIALADSATIDVGAPKGVEGADGIRCTGTATQDGHTLTYTNYVGADAGEMAATPARERAWQQAECRYLLEQDMAGWFWYQHGVRLDPTHIHMTTKRL